MEQWACLLILMLAVVAKQTEAFAVYDCNDTAAAYAPVDLTSPGPCDDPDRHFVKGRLHIVQVLGGLPMPRAADEDCVPLWHGLTALRRKSAHFAKNDPFEPKSVPEGGAVGGVQI